MYYMFKTGALNHPMTQIIELTAIVLDWCPHRGDDGVLGLFPVRFSTMETLHILIRHDIDARV